MRMNDAHGLQEFRQRFEKKSGNYDDWALLCPSEYWQKHPEFRRAAYREECSFESVFDFSLKEIRKRHLLLIKEALERWDVDGFELDWMRWGMHFKPGFQKEGLQILNNFMREVKLLIIKAEKKYGHKIMLEVRIP